MTARQILARIATQRLEQALLDAILVRLSDRGRILPGEELHSEPTLGGGRVVYEMPGPR